jgi:hypothetical protein
METKTFKQIEAEAASIARSLRNQSASLPALYVQGESCKLTKEQAIARALEADPAIYEAYRRQHNARALINTLKAAGVQIIER